MLDEQVVIFTEGDVFKENTNHYKFAETRSGTKRRRQVFAKQGSMLFQELCDKACYQKKFAWLGSKDGRVEPIAKKVIPVKHAHPFTPLYVHPSPPAIACAHWGCVAA